MKTRILLAAMSCMALLSCSSPRSYEQFVRMDQTTDTCFVFKLDLSDSSCRYDISFYTKVDRPAFSSGPEEGFGMDVSWTSESGNTFNETVWYPSGQECVLYRSDVDMVEHCNYSLHVKPSRAPQGLRGIGIICRRKEL